jgi:phosphate:Na+ symporter
MAECAISAIKGGIYVLYDYKSALAEEIRESEEKTDHYEDIIGNYLVKLSSHKIDEDESAEAARLLRIIGDFERISDHGVNLLESAEELMDKGIVFSDDAKEELKVLSDAVSEICELTLNAFSNNRIDMAFDIEPLEQIIDRLKEQLRAKHIERLQKGECSIEAGFVLSDLLTSFERTSDHCSNVAGCMIETSHHNLNMHESLRIIKSESEDFKNKYAYYSNKYAIKNS